MITTIDNSNRANLADLYKINGLALTTIHEMLHEAKRLDMLGELTNSSLFTNQQHIEISNLANISPKLITEFTEHHCGPHLLHFLATKNGCKNTTSFSLLLDALETNHIGLYQERTNALNIRELDLPDSYHHKIMILTQTYLHRLLQLARHSPRRLRLQIMCTNEEARRFANLSANEIALFSISGVFPFTFYANSIGPLVNACVNHNPETYARHVNCERIRILSPQF
jgi:hypothetical protein